MRKKSRRVVSAFLTSENQVYSNNFLHDSAAFAHVF